MKKPIYIKRNLLLSLAFRLWMKETGFYTNLPKDDVHVTLAYSRNPVDPDSITLQEHLIMDASGTRTLQLFGDAVVLVIENEEFKKRWEELAAAGCSWDHEDYQPHITITYEKPAEMDLPLVKPFSGQLIFGPEILEDLNLDKGDEYVEIDTRQSAKDLSHW